MATKKFRMLDVFWESSLVGHLRQNENASLGFRYAPEWLAREDARALSISLPLEDRFFRHKDCRPFFSGLLPEEIIRETITRSLGISEGNDFSLLEKIGGECAGAVSLMPEGEPPPPSQGNYREISTADLAALMEELPSRPLLAGEEGIRLSLAGAQGKLAIATFGDQLFLPLDGSPSTHIIKPRSTRFAGLVENEHFCMTLAKRLGLEVAEVSMEEAGGISYLSVKRYDRQPKVDGKLRRIHQEDFCQALGIPPEFKYQQEGGPSLKRCFSLLREVSSAPAADVLALIDAVAFNYLIGNNDAHGKNFSLIYEGYSTRLAPLYDLVCTRAFPELAPAMAMRIGREAHPAKVSAGDWHEFFKDAGVNPIMAGRRLGALAARVEKLIHEKASPAPSSVAAVILENCGMMKWIFGKGS